MRRLFIVLAALLVAGLPAPVAATEEARPTCASLRAWGDFDSDGGADAVVADPAATVAGLPGVGQITVVYGRRESPVPDRTEILRPGDGIVPAGEAGDRFGATVEVGYVDSDECADVLVGVPGKTVDGLPRAGAIVVLFGSIDGLGRRRQPLVWTERAFGGTPEPGDRFGSVVALPAGVDNGFSAVAVGVPRQDVGGLVDAGAVMFAELGSTGLPIEASRRTLTQSTLDLGDAPETGDRFGSALAMGDFSSGLGPGLLIGTPRESIGRIAKAGVLDLVFRLRVGDTPWAVRWTEEIIRDQTVDRGDRFGAAVTFARDGFTGISKFAVGAPGEDVEGQRNAGRVFVSYDEVPPPDRLHILDQSDERYLERPEKGDRFGSTLIMLPRYVTGSQTKLAIGVPGEDHRRVRDAGLVQTVSIDVYDFGTWVVISQDLTDSPGRPGAGDRLGAVLGSRPSSGIDSPGGLLIGLPNDSEYPDGAVMFAPYPPVDESDPTEPRYDLQVWVPGQGAFPAGGTEFGGAVAGAHGDFP